MAAVYDAVKFKKPILDRYVAVGGSAVVRPQVMKARIGTRIGELIEQCGGFSSRPRRIATGSPLSGAAVADLDEPVVKSCYAICAMAKPQARDNAEWSCISCGECRAVCPVGLDPEAIYKRIKSSNAQTRSVIDACHGCACCEAVCPSRLPLSEVILGERLGVNHA
jgi:electron transport complex protein RnfC